MSSCRITLTSLLLGTVVVASVALGLLGLVAEQSLTDNAFSKHRFVTADVRFDDYWSSFFTDGKTLLFSRRPVKNDSWDLFTVSIDGGVPRRFA